MFLKNRNISSKIKRSKVTDNAALTKKKIQENYHKMVIFLLFLSKIVPLEHDSLITQSIPMDRKHSIRPPDKSAYWKIIFFIHIQNICCGYSKGPVNETVL